MDLPSLTFDPVWERDIYSQGRHLNRYPFDSVVSFVYRFRPRDRQPAEIRILEVGCGAGNNLWFAAREGFQVAGVDASPTALAFARDRFAQEDLTGDFRVADFTALPFADGEFDLAVDRGAITCVGRSAAERAVAEVWRVLRPGGRFFFNPYAQGHTSEALSKAGPDELRIEFSGGTLVGVGQLRFYSQSDCEALFAENWKLLSIQRLDLRDLVDPSGNLHAEWRVVAEKTGSAPSR